MQLSRLILFGAAIACAAPAAFSQASPPASGGAEAFNWSVAPFHQFESDLDAGGSASLSAIFATIGAGQRLTDRTSLRADLRFDYFDWRFSDPTAFGGRAPWDEVYQPSLAVGASYVTDGGWRLTFAPTIQMSGESGARTSDAMVYGAIVSGAKRFGPDLTLGLGAGVFSRIEKTSAFPFIVVDWRFAERWRLRNPTAAGPAGPAGLEANYDLGGRWNAGVGAAWRSYRFRLDENGPNPNGIGEFRTIPVYVQLTRDVSRTFRVEFYGGVNVASRLYLEDPQGNLRVKDELDAAPVLGLILSGRF